MLITKYLSFSSLQLALLTLIFCVALAASVNASAADKHPVAIAIHGGAGTIRRELMSPEIEAEYRAILSKAILSGHDLGGSTRKIDVSAFGECPD